ncbi:MAG: PD40 domain-containing protein, partial [Phycisphaerales bacterium]
KSDIPDTLRPKGFTSSGSYHYTVEFKTIEAVVAELDLQTGRLLTKPQAVGQTGAGQIPAWSPDGRLLAYGIHKPDQSQTIRIQDIETGGERELDPNLPHFSWLRWSPDGNSFLVSNFAKNSPRAIYRINADTGERLTMVQSESSDTLPGQPQLSADGSILYYVLFHSDSDKASLLMRDIESGHEEELFALEGTRDIRGLNFALSPDGRQLALATEKMMTSAAGVDKRIFIMPAKGGEPRELWKTEGRATRPPIAWTADGQALLFTKRIPKGGRELWLIPARGGQARKLCSSQEMMCPGMMYGSMHSALDMHPDGQRIAFDCFEYRHEVWAMENFLPGAPAPVARPESETTTLRKLPNTWGGCPSISPDGRYMCDVDWDIDWKTEPEKLVVRELVTGKVRVLPTTGHPEYSAISPTGTQVAFLCYDPNWENPGLYTVGLDGSDRRCVRQDDCLIPKDWSPDGSKILALEPDEDPKQLVWVSVADGSIEHIVSVDRYYLQGEGHPGKFDVSPDGRFIAYDRRQAEDSEKHDLFIFDLVKNRANAIASHPAHEKLLGWTPDGRSILFASDRTGTWNAWLQRVTNGVPQGFPELIKKNMGDIIPIGLTQGGAFYYHTGNKPVRDVFVATLDFEKGQVLASPMPVCQTGAGHFPAWSPDGRELAYCAGRPGERKILHIRNLATGHEREIATGLPVFAFAKWSADGRSIVGSTVREQPHAIYKIDVQTGERTELLRSTTGLLWQCELFRDGKTLLYSRQDANSVYRHYLVRNLTTGREKSLVQATRPIQLRGFALSPDKQWLAYITSVRGSSGVQSLKVVPAEGGEPRTLIQFDESDKMWLRGVTWMADSQHVLFGKWLMENKGGELWRISTQGDEPEKLWTWKTPLASLSVHPDGQRIAFHTSTTASEMWVIENFLPRELGK